MFPEHRHAVEGVHHAVVVGEAKGDGRGVEGARQAQPRAGDRNRGAQVQLDGVVQLVGVDSVDLGDVEVVVGREPVEDFAGQFQKSEPELRREHCLKKALAEGQDPE